MAKKNQTKFLKRKHAFQLWQVIVFVAIFAGVGIFAIIASAAPRNHSSATMQVSPNPAQNDSTVNLTVTGCGYTPGAGESLIGNSTSGQWAIGLGLADGQGCINTQTGSISTGTPGTYTLQVREQNPKNHKNTIVASTAWVIQ